MMETGKPEAKTKTCPGCGSAFDCLHHAGCWCMTLSLSKETLAWLKENYRDCLCRDCLLRAEALKKPL